MRVINMAHGDMLMLGAYTAFVVTDPHWLPKWLNDTLASFGYDAHIEFNIFWAIPASFLVVGFVGYLMEIFLIRYLYGRPLDTLLATWGVGLIFQQLVNLKFGANLQPMHLPEMLQGNWQIGELAIPLLSLVHRVGGSVVLVGGVFVVFQNLLGPQDSRGGAKSPDGIGAGHLDAARGFADLCLRVRIGRRLAGCILAHLYNVKYTMGNDYVVDAFMVVILGGMGQLSGSVAGAAVIGTGTGFVEKWAGSLPMAKVVILGIVICFLLIRPAGLFALKERSYE